MIKMIQQEIDNIEETLEEFLEDLNEIEFQQNSHAVSFTQDSLTEGIISSLTLLWKDRIESKTIVSELHEERRKLEFQYKNSEWYEGEKAFLKEVYPRAYPISELLSAEETMFRDSVINLIDIIYGIEMGYNVFERRGEVDSAREIILELIKEVIHDNQGIKYKLDEIYEDNNWLVEQIRVIEDRGELELYYL